jgi:Flp pilus assembly pilin Flp
MKNPMYRIATVLQGRISALLMQMRREEGQTMAEYAILVVVIAIVVLTAATLFGHSISSVLSSIAGKI